MTSAKMDTKTMILSDMEYAVYDTRKRRRRAMKDKLLCQGYVRPDGSKGIRNKVLVIYTVECCRALSERIARHFQEELGQDVEAVGTSSCLDNQADIRLLLRFSTHPNVGAVLAIGHGCEYIQASENRGIRPAERPGIPMVLPAGGRCSVKGYDKGLRLSVSC